MATTQRHDVEQRQKKYTFQFHICKKFKTGKKNVTSDKSQKYSFLRLVKVGIKCDGE